jgi:outer membrane immunogenic protein
MPLKVPVLAPSWTGYHLGLALGARRLAADWTTTALTFGGVPFADNVASFDSSGFRAGGYAGYDYQIDRIVLGIEAGGGDANSSNSKPNVPGLGGMVLPGPDMTSVQSSWDANTVGRIGYLVAPDVLLYGLGGVAWQSVKVSAVCTAASFECQFDHSESFGNTLLGGVVGGGLEAMVARNWLLRLDHRYADFGSINHTFFVTESVLSPTATIKINTQTVSFGIAYKIGPNG